MLIIALAFELLLFGYFGLKTKLLIPTACIISFFDSFKAWARPEIIHLNL